MTAYLHTCSIRPDGTKDSFLTQKVEWKESPLWWQNAGLSFTASGYGARIPTRRMIKLHGKWRRVYSNSGTLFIGKKCDGSAIVQFED